MEGDRGRQFENQGPAASLTRAKAHAVGDETTMVTGYEEREHRLEVTILRGAGFEGASSAFEKDARRF